MSLVEITVDSHELDELDEKLHADPKKTMGTIADRLVGSLRKRVESGPGPALSAATLEIRRRRGQGGSKPLEASGRMAGSIRRRATAKLAYAGIDFPAAALQAGFTTSAKSAIPGKVVPARPFVYLDEVDADFAAEQIAAFYLDGGTDG